MPPCRKLPESGPPKNGEPGGREILTRQRIGAAELTRQSGAKREGLAPFSRIICARILPCLFERHGVGLVSWDDVGCQTWLVCGPLLADVLAADPGAT